MLLRLANEQVPAESTTPPNKGVQLIPYTPTRDEIIEKRVSKFASNLKTTFTNFLKNDVQLPLYDPPSELDDKTRRHITGLKIPIITRSSRVLLLLLHNLGQSSHDANLADRVNGLFVWIGGNTFHYVYSEISR
jgi:hypothetical protein